MQLFYNGVMTGIVSSLLGLVVYKLIGFLFEQYRVKKGLFRQQAYSLEERYQRRKQASALLDKYGIVVHQYWMPTLTMLNDLGISKPTPELYWAIHEFEGECFVLTDKKGRQWGGMIPLYEAKEQSKKCRKLRMVK